MCYVFFLQLKLQLVGRLEQEFLDGANEMTEYTLSRIREGAEKPSLPTAASHVGWSNSIWQPRLSSLEAPTYLTFKKSDHHDKNKGSIWILIKHREK